MLRTLLIAVVLLASAGARAAPDEFLEGGPDRSLCQAWVGGCQRLSLEGAPSARHDELWIWTGSRLIVWGGQSADGRWLQDGAVLDPEHNRWQPMATAAAPTVIGVPLAVWTGTELLVWGGDRTQPQAALFDPLANRWRAVSMEGAPRSVTPSQAWAVALSGKVLLWPDAGGVPFPLSRPAWRFDPRANHWDMVPPFPGIPATLATTTVAERWLFTFGGYRVELGPLTPVDTGAIYDIESNGWRLLPIAKAPSPRYVARVGWDGAAFVVTGGRGRVSSDTPELSGEDGARFEVAAHRWLPLASHARAGQPFPPAQLSFDPRMAIATSSLATRTLAGDALYRVPDQVKKTPPQLLRDDYGATDLRVLAQNDSRQLLSNERLSPAYLRESSSGDWTELPSPSAPGRSFRVAVGSRWIVAWGGWRVLKQEEYDCSPHCPPGAPCMHRMCVRQHIGLYRDGMLLAQPVKEP